jgi:hypothetical protein
MGNRLFACLSGLAIALIVVGVVSGTILRHVVQIAPIAIAVAVGVRRPALGAYAALPIFVFWTLIVVLIWLFLLGLSRIANGHYTIAEIISTVVMAACCVYGAIGAVSIGRALPIAGRVLAFVTLAVLQFAAMWISFLPAIASR